MDGFSDFIKDVAAVAGIAALLASAIIRRHLILITLASVAVTFLGVFGCLVWLSGAGIANGAIIAVIIALFVSPILVAAILIGKGAAKIVERMT